MTPGLSSPAELIALGGFVGALVLVICFSAFNGYVYRERALLLHAAGSLMAVLAVQSLAGAHPFYPEAAMLLLLAFSGLQLRELVSHAGAMRDPRRWLMGASLLLPLLSIAAAPQPWLLLPGTALWLAVVLVLLLRAWPQSQPWIWWLLPGVAALIAVSGVVAANMAVPPDHKVLLTGALLTVWAGSTYLATAWRGRIFGETRARIDASSTIDPLTGLSMPLVLEERIRAARTLMLRYGHPSVLLLVHVENLPKLAHEFGPEVGEAAVLGAAKRVRESLREGDVAARLAHSRIGVLVEGMPAAEGAANVASRILVAGLKEPLPAAPAEFLHFRIVLSAVPVDDVPARQLLARLNSQMDRELHEPSQRRIVTMPSEELAA